VSRKQLLAARLRIARDESGLSQDDLGKMYGCSGAAISQMERGVRGIGMDALEKFSKIFDKPVEWFWADKMEASNLPQKPIELMLKEVNERIKVFDLAEIPIWGNVPAGYPFPVEENQEGYVQLPKTYLGKSKDTEGLFALRVSGDSLIGDGISSGDMVIVEPAAKIQDGKIYILRIEHECLVRHVSKKAGKLRLSSSNGDYAEMEVDNVEILGRVILAGNWKIF